MILPKVFFGRDESRHMGSISQSEPKAIWSSSLFLQSATKEYVTFPPIAKLSPGTILRMSNYYTDHPIEILLTTITTRERSDYAFKNPCCQTPELIVQCKEL